MEKRQRLTFVTASNDQGILESNLLASPHFREHPEYQLIIQEGFASAAEAYNNAIEKSENDLIVFTHQDILYPSSWISDFLGALEFLRTADPDWGVLGTCGMSSDGRFRGHCYSHGLGIIGAPFDHPMPVQSLDEVVLVLRKSSGLRFDEKLSGFHLYGTDICMTALAKGYKNYAFPGFIVHNTRLIRRLPEDFYECHRFVARKWKRYLPIENCCLKLTRFGTSMWRRRLLEIYWGLSKGKLSGPGRLADPALLLADLEQKGFFTRPLSVEQVTT